MGCLILESRLHLHPSGNFYFFLFSHFEFIHFFQRYANGRPQVQHSLAWNIDGVIFENKTFAEDERGKEIGFMLKANQSGLNEFSISVRASADDTRMGLLDLALVINAPLSLGTQSVSLDSTLQIEAIQNSSECVKECGALSKKYAFFTVEEESCFCSDEDSQTSEEPESRQAEIVAIFCNSDEIRFGEFCFLKLNKSLSFPVNRLACQERVRTYV